MKKRPGDWSQVFTGKKFWPLDPNIDEVDIKDISHSLALQCRFNGHCENFYSIAQHSVLVSKLVPKDQALAALLHDASEAYIGDIIRPLKKFLPKFKKIELKIEKVIFEKFGVKNANQEEIKKADNIALITERRDLMKNSPGKWKEEKDYKPSSEKIIAVGPEEAEKKFLERFKELTNNNF